MKFFIIGFFIYTFLGFIGLLIGYMRAMELDHAFQMEELKRASNCLELHDEIARKK